MNSSASPSAPARLAFLTPVLAAGCFVLALRGAWLAAVHRVPLSFVYGAAFSWVAVGLLAAVPITGLVLWRSTSRQFTGSWNGPLLALRHAFTVGCLGWLAFLTLVQPFQRLHFDLALGLIAGGWALVWFLVQRRRERPSGLARRADFVLFILCIAAIGTEWGLRAVAGAQGSALFARIGVGPAKLVQRFANPPGELRFGFPCNSGGYYDEPFFRKTDTSDDRLIISIGDSFSVGAVPHALHYTTLLEELTGDTVYNMGVAGIGPPEYAYLVALEAAPLNPDEILISIFIGNDLDVPDTVAELPDPLLRSWWQREQVLLFVVPPRLARISRESDRLSDVARVQGERATPGAPDRSAVAVAFPWTADPLLEEPTLGEVAFLRLETTRALSACAARPISFDLLCRALLEARRAAGEASLSVMLIPDEFQVEDALWEQVTQRAERPLERDRPQNLLNAWLADQGIPCLDLLPIMREVEPLADGSRHLYHARDTHWNARGNRIAAQALADFLR